MRTEPELLDREGAATDAAFGTLLREWRIRRRTSQLDLALASGVSARHVSFLETGRSRPSRAMALRLAEALDVPLDARNELLLAAGFAPGYRRRQADEADMALAHRAVAWMVDRHDPFPAFALDRHWRITRWNRTAARLLTTFGIDEGDDLLDAFLSNAAMQAAIVNMEEVAAHTRSRLVAELQHYGADSHLENALAQLDALVPAGKDGRCDGAFVPVRYRLGAVELSLFSAFSHFLTARDIALAELRVEMMFPADDHSHELLVNSVDADQ